MSLNMLETVGPLTTVLVDNSGGTAADTIADIGATYTEAEVNNAVASLAAKVNEIIVALNKANSGG